MNSLTQTLVSKTGADNGWEYCVSQTSEVIELASARHRYRAYVMESEHQGGFLVRFEPILYSGDGLDAVAAQMVDLARGIWEAFNREVLGALLRRAAELAIALPDAPERRYRAQIEEYLQQHPDARDTEAEALIRRRMGQDVYREALLVYWSGCCAVTGCDVPEILRASHAKPWAEASDQERLDVHNGFLLRADLDALFDAGLITFSDAGELVPSPVLSPRQLRDLSLDTPRTLRRTEPAHLPYLKYHRERVWRK